MRRPIRSGILCVGFLAAAAGAARAQETVPVDTTDISWAQRVVIHSNVLGEDRPLYIRLPYGYDFALSDRYPVVYLLDGDTHILPVSGMVQGLEFDHRMPEVIVVAIPNTRDRTHDLTPPATEDSLRLPMAGIAQLQTQRFPTAGGADRFLDFLTTELMPWTESHFRTLPYRVLVGHSLGGLFALDVLMARPSAFNAYIAVSPSLWWDGGRFELTLERRLPTSPAAANRLLYMTTGGLEFPYMIDPARSLARSLERTHPSGFRSWYRIMPGEDHSSNPHRTIYDGLETLFSTWAISDSAWNRAAVLGDLAGIDAHYVRLSNEVGLQLAAPEWLLNRIAEGLLQRKRVEEAVRVLRRNVGAHPESPNTYDSLAHALEAAGRLDEALRTQDEAVRRAEAIKYSQLEALRKGLDRLRKRAAH